ncbi:MAG: hypothetical protein J2P27_01075 [Actinobacteria bacterium]|nr:hypothetical protein [Actinomycetota bacterium]
MTAPCDDCGGQVPADHRIQVTDVGWVCAPCVWSKYFYRLNAVESAAQATVDRKIAAANNRTGIWPPQ